MTDLELMQLLEDEGYLADLENLCILKEGLETGEIEILESTSSQLKKAKKEIETHTDPFKYTSARSTVEKHKTGRELARELAKGNIKKTDELYRLEVAYGKNYADYIKNHKNK